MLLNYIKGKYDTSLNYIKGKLLASQSAVISRKPKIKKLEYDSEIYSKTQSIMHLLYKRKASTISQISLLGRSFILG